MGGPRNSGLELDGSPLAVLQHWAFPSFETATFLDYEPKVVAALNERIGRLNLQAKAQAVEADYNDPGPIISILRQRFAKGLSLVFIDPTDCRTMAIRFKRATPASWKHPRLRQHDVDRNFTCRSGRIMFPTAHDITDQNIEECLTVLRRMLAAGNDLLPGICKPVPKWVPRRNATPASPNSASRSPCSRRKINQLTRQFWVDKVQIVAQNHDLSASRYRLIEQDEGFYEEPAITLGRMRALERATEAQVRTLEKMIKSADGAD